MADWRVQLAIPKRRRRGIPQPSGDALGGGWQNGNGLKGRDLHS